ncbi:MAG: hypothetical protein LBK42_11900 [Propionibacteriaceae bacterium]|nr:hypothetical protein [Propionibacteriaceae bacterium]
MRRLLVLLVVLVVAGCTAGPEPAPTPTVGAVYPTRTSVPVPSASRFGDNFYDGTMWLAGCEPVDGAFFGWANGDDRRGGRTTIAGNGHVEAIAIGGVVVSHTAEWAVIGVRVDGGANAVYVTQNPPTPPAGPDDTNFELILAGHVTYGLYHSYLGGNTVWAGGLLDLGKDAAAAALACVS